MTYFMKMPWMRVQDGLNASHNGWWFGIPGWGSEWGNGRGNLSMELRYTLYVEVTGLNFANPWA